MGNKIISVKKCYLCEGEKFSLLKEISEKPDKETEFDLKKDNYLRKIKVCNICDVYINDHSYDLDKIYSEQYNSKTYLNDIETNFERIRNLSFSKSDNKQRVDRIIKYLKKNGNFVNAMKLLDIGSGLGVFPAEIKLHNLKVSCIDPSLVSIKHLRKNVKVDHAIHGEFLGLQIKERYDLITLNKVLEHVKNPIAMLSKAKKLLKPGGLIYIEVPNGDSALENGDANSREEFFIDHHTIFNIKSVKYLISKSKLLLKQIQEIHEPSDKYTIYSFISKYKD